MSFENTRPRLTPRFNVAFVGTSTNARVDAVLSNAMVLLRQRVPACRCAFLLGESATSVVAAAGSDVSNGAPQPTSLRRTLRRILAEVDLTVLVWNEDSPDDMAGDLRAICDANGIALLVWPLAEVPTRPRGREARALAAACEQVYSRRHPRDSSTEIAARASARWEEAG